MIEQGNRTEQLIYRTSYRKHKERLADIRHNITAIDFLPPRNHHSAKKYNQRDRMKKDEIQPANSYLKSKINAIKNRTNSKIDELYSTQQLRKQPRRYFDQINNETKIEVNSELVDGDSIKFVLPSNKNPSTSLNVKIKEIPKGENKVAQTKMNSIENTYKKFSSNSVFKETQRDVKTAKQTDLLYNLPQRNENRVVIYKKTLIFSSMQSCLLELSLINDRLLIAAYLMGLENSTLRQLYSLKRTSEVLKECENNYEQLCSRFYIQKANDKYQYIRLLPKEEEGKEKEEKDKQEDKNKQKAKIQNEFIKRNYYTLAKTDEQQKQQKQEQKSKPSYTFDHVQAIVERLAAPKRFFKLRQQKSEKIEKIKAVSNYEKTSKPHQLSHEELQKQTAQKKIIPKNQSQNNISKMHESKERINKSIASTQQAKKEDQNYEQLYEQQFDNPSSIKNSKLHSLQKSKDVRQPMKQSIKSQLKQSVKVDIKNTSEVYEHQFQKQAQQYEQSFEKNEDAHSPVAKIANNSSVPAENVEQQYAEQFAD